MTVEAMLLAATTLIALVAVVVAIVAVRAVRDVKRSLEFVRDGQETLQSALTAGTNAEISACEPDTNAETFVPATPTLLAEIAPRVVEGRVVVPPTRAQVVRTALGRPGVRLNIFVHGLARALRPENRDRIVALMRREFRHRRRERLRAGRQAIRLARPTSAPSTDRLHENLLEPKPLSLTDRMISS